MIKTKINSIGNEVKQYPWVGVYTIGHSNFKQEADFIPCSITLSSEVGLV